MRVRAAKAPLVVDWISGWQLTLFLTWSVLPDSKFGIFGGLTRSGDLLGVNKTVVGLIFVLALLSVGEIFGCGNNGDGVPRELEGLQDLCLVVENSGVK